MEGLSNNTDESAAGCRSEVHQNPNDADGEEKDPQVAERSEMIQGKETNQRELRKSVVKTNYGEDYPDFNEPEHDDTTVGVITRSARRGKKATVLPTKKEKADLVLDTSNAEIIVVLPSVKTTRRKSIQKQRAVEQQQQSPRSTAEMDEIKPKGRLLAGRNTKHKNSVLEEPGWETSTTRPNIKSFGKMKTPKAPLERTPQSSLFWTELKEEPNVEMSGPKRGRKQSTEPGTIDVSPMEAEPAAKRSRKVNRKKTPVPNIQVGSDLEAIEPHYEQAIRGEAKPASRTSAALLRTTNENESEGSAVLELSDAQVLAISLASNDAKTLDLEHDTQRHDVQETPIQLIDTKSIVDEKPKQEEHELRNLNNTGAKPRRLESDLAVNLTALPQPTHGNGPQSEASVKGCRDKRIVRGKKKQTNENEPDATTFIETSDTQTREIVYFSDETDELNCATANNAQLQTAQKTPMKSVETASIVDEKSKEKQHELSAFTTIDAEASQLDSEPTVSQTTLPKPSHEKGPEMKASLKGRRNKQTIRGKASQVPRTRSSSTRSGEEDSKTSTKLIIYATANDTQRQGAQEESIRATENAVIVDDKLEDAQQHGLSTLKDIDTEHDQRKNETTFIQATLPESTNEKEMGTVLEASEKEHEYGQRCRRNKGRGRRTRSASVRKTRKVPEISEFLEESETRARKFSNDAKKLNHLTDSDTQRQEAGQASSKANQSLIARTDEATYKHARRTSSRVSLQDSGPAQKRPRQTSQRVSLNTRSEREAETLAPPDSGAATAKDPSPKTKAIKSSSASRRLAGMKVSASIFPRSKKMGSPQTNRTPIRSSATGTTHLRPNYSEESVQEKISVDAENSEHFYKSKRMNVQRSVVSHGRRSLAPLKRPPPPPQPPEGLKCKWTYTDETRMFLADFRDLAQVPEQDMKFLLKLMARDDLVVVSEGLWNPAFEELLRLEYLEAAFGNQVQHKFRMFSRKKEGGYAEKPEGVSMCANDFFRYLEMKAGKEVVSRRFAFTDLKGKRHEIDVDEVSIYLIDCDLPKFLPLFYDKYLAYCKMPEILPGGEMCMMNAMNREGRPFMGPNLYIAPGGGFTSLHQDGEGTVDSGHSCITGYNEVVMLRRMPEEHKHFAAEQLGYDGVHRLPHDVGTKYENIWPKKSVIKKWEEMNYCPSVFVLRPGQHLHINKGRLHTFRKVKTEPLELDDCHYDLRKDLLDCGILKRDELCISIAFDWMFLGHSREAINEEVKTALQCADICRDVGTSSLGIPETCLLRLAKFLSHEGGTICNKLLHPIRNAACQGILPHLQTIVQREIESGSGISNRATIADNQQDPDSYSIDPFGADYFCQTCKKELANSYFHCLGCERLLQKDLNICRMCLEEKKYGANIRMGVACKSRNSDIIHAGFLNKNRNTKGCSCHQGICRECGYCKSCSCRCHHEFQLHYRFFMPDELKDMVKRVEKLAKASDEHVETFADPPQPTAEAGNFSTEHIEKEAVLPVCDSGIQKNCGEAECFVKQSLTLQVDGTDKPVTSEIVRHDAIPIRASELDTNHFSLPGTNYHSTLKAPTPMPNQAVNHDAAQIAQNALLAPSGPFLTTPKDISPGKGGYQTYFEDVKINAFTSPR